MFFNELSKCFQSIEKTSGRLEITKLLTDIFNNSNPEEAKIIANLALGVLHPSYVGTQFNLASKSLLVVVSRLLNKSLEDVKDLAKKYGDIGELVLNEYHNDKPTNISVEDIYNRLDILEKISGTGSSEKKIEDLVRLLQEVTPLEAKYILRAINGTLRLGFSTMTIIDALSWYLIGNKSLRAKLERAYNSCADIGLLAYSVVKYKEEAPEHFKINIGVPIAPSAAERMDSAQEIIEKIGPAVAQLKLDGFRLQIHLEKTKDKFFIKFFSRNLKDMSEMFPDLVKAFKKLDIDSLICEGEAIVFDKDKNRFLPFQETVKRKRKHGVEEASKELPLRLYLFDILYLNGESLIDLSHTHRREILQSIIPSDNNDFPIKVIEEKVVNTGPELAAYFKDVISKGLEGLVVKKKLGHYIPGKRNFNWVKLKKHSKDAIADTIDTVILGYYLGEGKRSNFGIGSFLVGVYNKKKDIFQTIAKVGTGLSDTDWKILKDKCDKIKVWKKPHNVEVVDSLKPDIWVEPQIVCELKADEITQSPTHTSGNENGRGYALRFPRFVKYRDDKSVFDSTSVQEVERLFALQTS